MLRLHKRMLRVHNMAILIGRNCFQHKAITWSYLKRGKEVLTHINIPQINVPLTTNRIKLSKLLSML